MTLDVGWTQAGPAVLAAFLASLVEFVEALTVVLAVGSTRGWRAALSGSAAALLVLLALVAAFGSLLTLVKLATLQLALGVLTLLFGLRWLRKAVLRAAGVLALHDEAAEYARQTRALQGSVPDAWDGVAFATAFQITLVEGTEVVFIVLAVGAGGAGLLLPASLGALAALLLVVLLGLALHRPLTRVPENTLKFTVGVLLAAFGTFWAGEGIGLQWPGADWSILLLAAGFLATALAGVRLCRGAA
jgi:uncharacterized membrane protein